MAQVNLSGHSGKQTETLEEPQCVAGRAHEIHLPVIFLAAANIILSINAFHGNTPFIRHPNLFQTYASFFGKDRLVICLGLISQPSIVMNWLSLLHEEWSLSLCRTY